MSNDTVGEAAHPASAHPVAGMVSALVGLVVLAGAVALRTRRTRHGGGPPAPH